MTILTMRKNIFLLLTVVLLFAGCTMQNAYHETLERAKRLMNERPDSALELLDSIFPYQSTFSKSMRMDYMLQRLNAQNKCDTIFRSDSTARILVDYYSHHGTNNQRMLANYLAGRVYYDMGELPMSLQFYHDAADCADTTQTNCDYATLLRVHSQMGELYKRQFLLKSSLNEYSKAARYSLMCNDSIHYIIHLNLQGNVYGLMGKEDSALIIKEKAAAMLYNLGYEEYAAQTLGSGAAFLTEQGKLVKAKQYIELYRTKSGFFQADGNTKKGYENYYYTIGLYFLKNQQLDSAEHYFRKLLDNSTAFNDQLCAAQGLCRLYKQLHKVDSVAKYSEYSYNVNDSAYNHINSNNLLQMQAMYDYSRNKYLAEQRLETIHNSNIKIGILCVIIILIMLFFVVAFRFYKREKEIKEGELRDTREMYRQDKARLVKEKMKLEREKSQNDGLLHEEITKQEAIIELLSERISDYETQYGKVPQFDIDEKLFSSDIYHRFEEYTRYVLNSPTENEWKALEQLIEENIPKFNLLLKKKYKINENEYRICLLLRLGFPPTTIAVLIGKSYSYVSKTRGRLLNVVFGKRGKPEDFDMQLKRIF